MNVVIFSGGSGPAILEEGINLYHNELNVSVIVNGFDNGKSTGAVRQVFDGEILGPSDIRKNQARMHKLDNGSEIYDVLEHRFTSDNPHKYVIDYLDMYITNGSILFAFKEIIDRYFDSNEKVKSIRYNDFSIGNIIYAQLAHENNNSMQAASDIIRNILKIKNEVLVTDDKSFFLKAITKNNIIIDDEAEIVEYNNSEDYITDIMFTDASNNEYEYSLINDRCIETIGKADIIIFSSGTQWSSLIPTYKSRSAAGVDFKDIINTSTAKKYLVMNCSEDKDMIGRNADDILDIVSNYINLNDVQILLPDNGSILSNSAKYNGIKIRVNETKHYPSVISDIMSLYFNKPTYNDVFCFDWDDTIMPRNDTNNLYKKALGMFEQLSAESATFIITGNTHRKVVANKIYADGALNYYENNVLKYCLAPEFKLSNNLIDRIKVKLIELGFNSSMFSDRNSTCFSIKPIDPFYRKAIKYIIDSIISNTNFRTYITGKTTIDIMHKDADKSKAMFNILDKYPKSKVYYCGDEYLSGNDAIIYGMSKKINDLQFVKINSVNDTITFIKTIRQ